MYTLHAFLHYLQRLILLIVVATSPRMLLPPYLSASPVFHLHVSILLFTTLTFTPSPTHARTVHRWGSLTPVHEHSHSRSHSHPHSRPHLNTPAIKLNTPTDSTSPETRLAALPIPSATAPDDNGTSDDWLKWHHERHVQQEMRRKLECRTVEFGRCKVQKQRMGVEIEIEDVVVAGEGKQEDGHEEQDDFIGKRLPRNLQDWLATQGVEGT